jgi:3-phenylpropionate/trans-cinnamate dioxygenase ferredoxin component
VSLTCRRIRLGRLGDVTTGLRRFDVEGHRIVVVRLGEALFAFDDTCSHESASLAEEGEVDAEAREIECCRHGARFSLDDGAATSLPATTGLRTYPVALDGDDVFIELL